MQRELLACDAEEPLEIWGWGENPEIPAWWLLLFLI